jgi:hypothetical protein
MCQSLHKPHRDTFFTMAQATTGAMLFLFCNNLTSAHSLCAAKEDYTRCVEDKPFFRELKLARGCGVIKELIVFENDLSNFTLRNLHSSKVCLTTGLRTNK